MRISLITRKRRRGVGTPVPTPRRRLWRRQANRRLLGAALALVVLAARALRVADGRFVRAVLQRRVAAVAPVALVALDLVVALGQRRHGGLAFDWAASGVAAGSEVA